MVDLTSMRAVVGGEIALEPNIFAMSTSAR